MDIHLAPTIALVAVGVCGVVAALTIPVVVTSALRGNGRGAVLAAAAMLGLAAVAFAFAATIGANLAIYRPML